MNQFVTNDNRVSRPLSTNLLEEAIGINFIIMPQEVKDGTLANSRRNVFHQSSDEGNSSPLLRKRDKSDGDKVSNNTSESGDDAQK